MPAWLRFEFRRIKRLSKLIKRTEPSARLTIDSVVTALPIVTVRTPGQVHPGIVVHPVLVGPVQALETTL